MMLGLGVSVVSDAERYPGGNGITSGSIGMHSCWIVVAAVSEKALGVLASAASEGFLRDVYDNTHSTN